MSAPVVQADSVHSVLRLNSETLKGLISLVCPRIAKLTVCETDSVLYSSGKVSTFVKLRWLFVTSMLTGLIGLFLPHYLADLDLFDAAYKSIFVIGVAYLLLLIAALIRHRWRGLLLVVVPLVFFWPIGFALLNSPCKKNANACPPVSVQFTLH